MQSVRLALAALGLAALTACGGSQEEACHSSSFTLRTGWQVSGGTYGTIGEQRITGRVGVPLDARPVHTGIPAGCAGKAVYALGDAGHPLPAGLTLDASTGRISGTPTAHGETNGGNLLVGAVRVSFPGFQPSTVLDRLRIEL